MIGLTDFVCFEKSLQSHQETDSKCESFWLGWSCCNISCQSFLQTELLLLSYWLSSSLSFSVNSWFCNFCSCFCFLKLLRHYDKLNHMAYFCCSLHFPVSAGPWRYLRCNQPPIDKISEISAARFSTKVYSMIIGINVWISSILYFKIVMMLSLDIFSITVVFVPSSFFSKLTSLNWCLKF